MIRKLINNKYYFDSKINYKLGIKDLVHIILLIE